MENAKSMGPTTVMNILDQKQNMKKLGKMLLPKLCSIQRFKFIQFNLQKVGHYIQLFDLYGKI